MGSRIPWTRQWTISCNQCEEYSITGESRETAEKQREWHEHDDVEVISWKKSTLNDGDGQP